MPSAWSISLEQKDGTVQIASHSGVQDPESTREKPCPCRWLGEPSQRGAAPGMSLDPNGPSVPLLEAKRLRPESRLLGKGLQKVNLVSFLQLPSYVCHLSSKPGCVGERF